MSSGDSAYVEENFRSSPDEHGITQSGSSQDGALPTPLHAAAVNGNKALLRRLLHEDERQFLNKGDQFGRTPLVYSVLGDRLDCAETLLKAGANVSSCDMDGRTPLHWAAYQGNLKCVKLLLAKGANWKVKDSKGRTPLHFSTSHQSSKCLSLLLKQVPKGEADERDNDLMTSLHWSASYGNTEHVKLLLKAGADVTLTDSENRTPLHWGATNPDPAVLKLILDANFGIINHQDSEGRTALHLAVAQHNEAAVRALLAVGNCQVTVQDNMKRSPLHWAAVLGNSQLVKLLLDKGADFTAADDNGATALHYAAQGNFSETVEMFLSFDNIEDIPDKEGRTALMWAAGKGSEMALETMLNHDLDVHTKDNTDGTALHAAAYSGYVNCVELLVEFGACVNAVDKLQHTPLFRACEMGHTEVVHNLILNGAAIDLEDLDGRSPLHWAALGGHAPICLALVEQGVALDNRDKINRTPLQCAAHGGFVKFMTILIEHGAYVDHQDKDGITALHRSCASGHLEAVKLLLRNKAFPNFTEGHTDRLTPLDYAIIGDHQDVAQYMIEQGALTINGIEDIASTTIQKCWRGHRVRKGFLVRKDLFVKHERVKKVRKRASVAGLQRKTPDLCDNQTSRSVSPRGIETSTIDSSRSHDVILEQEQQRRESLSSSEEQGQSQVDLFVLEPQLPGSDVAQNITTERIFDNLSQGLSEEQTISASLSLIPREEESRKLSLANSELVKIVSSVLLDEDVELDECFSFSSGQSSSKESATESGSIDNEHSESRVTKMHSGLSKSELARKERERLHLIRTKVNAAVALQRWFRKWKSIKRERRERDMMMRDVTKEQEQLCEEVAALTIQLAWRKHMRTKFEKKNTMNKTDKPKKAAPTSASGKGEQNSIHIYGRPIQEEPQTAVVNSRKGKGRGRSPYMKYQPSPAALSYNMAMDLYHPLGSRQGSRAAMVTASPRMKSGCMKRTYGWTHDANFSRKINGQRSGWKDPKTGSL